MILAMKLVMESEAILWLGGVLSSGTFARLGWMLDKRSRASAATGSHNTWILCAPQNNNAGHCTISSWEKDFRHI